MSVVEIQTADTHALRRDVLRDGDPARPVDFPEDDLPGTFHLGVRAASGVIVATSSWVPKTCAEAPDAVGVQLRGMATAAELQGTGVGGTLFEAGAQRCRDAGFEVLWARARDSALGFYAKHGCRIVGEGFIDATTELPHHIVVVDLT
jgi:GNAT superfamily N-acetyltransferase